MSLVIGFKEWSVICDALGTGRQQLILRKGGIHEGRDGFAFRHSAFFLFPTRFHATTDEIREGLVDLMVEWQPGELLEITHHVEVLSAVTVTDWNALQKLEPYHIYTEKTIRDRFDWEGKGMSSGSIHVALVRIRELSTPWSFPYETKYGGCRSWIDLPSPPSDWFENSKKVVDDDSFSEMSNRYLAIVGAAQA
jgi:hypothetical protein